MNYWFICSYLHIWILHSIYTIPCVGTRRNAYWRTVNVKRNSLDWYKIAHTLLVNYTVFTYWRQKLSFWI